MTEHKDAMTPGQVAVDTSAAAIAELLVRVDEWWEYDHGHIFKDASNLINALSAELTALRAERDIDHANINLKADFIEATIDQLGQTEFERDAALARVGALEAALTQIAGQHIPDLPAYSAEDELGWAHRQYANQRDIARAAIAALTKEGE